MLVENEFEAAAIAIMEFAKGMDDLTTLPIDTNTFGDVDCSNFQLTTTQIADFFAGYMGGFSGHDDRADIEKCWTDSPAFEKNICTIVHDFGTKDKQKLLEAAQLLHSMFPDIIGGLSSCPANDQADIKVVTDWANYWIGQGTMGIYGHGYRNFIAHQQEIHDDWQKLSDEYDSGDWYNTAVTFSQIMRILLPVSTEFELADQLPCPKGFDLTTITVADCIAGFTHAFTGHDDKAIAEQCWHDTPEFRADMCDVYANIITKDNQKVLAAIQKFVGDLPETHDFMASCLGQGTFDADYDVLTTWYKYWHEQGMMRVYSSAYRNIVPLMKSGELKTHMDAMKASFSSGDYYGAADGFGTVLLIALPMPPSEQLFLQ